MKRKLITLILLLVLGFSACKKDELATPSTKIATEKVADKKDCGTWD